MPVGTQTPIRGFEVSLFASEHMGRAMGGRKAKVDSGIGTVRQTPEGEIRWTTFSIFHGDERWRSEGIQVGGLRSGRGVLGNWFDK